MSVICRKEFGAFLGHIPLARDYVYKNEDRRYEDTNNIQHADAQGFYHWKRELYDVNCPFMMDSQADRIRQEAAADHGARMKETSAQRKRRKKSQKGVVLTESEKKISDLINKVLPAIAEEARDAHYLERSQSSSVVVSSNDTARSASQVAGCGNMFQDFCCDFNNQNEKDQIQSSDTIVLKETSTYSAQFVTGRCFHNVKSCAVVIDVNSHKFIVPPCSSFLTSTFHHFVSGDFRKIQVKTGYDLIVIDPPWNNKSVKRKKSYHTVQETDLKQIPLSDLASRECLVCVWITNNDRLMRYVRDELFPHWSVEFVVEWLWIKVTKSGEPVCDVVSSHKKPYEQLIIGRMKDSCLGSTEAHRHNSTGPDSSAFTVSESEGATPKSLHRVSNTTKCLKQKIEEIPKDFVLVSVPCLLHSKKPTLAEIMSQYLPPSPSCLELFARNLTSGWTSWGNEPLLHQHVDFFEI